MLECKNDDTASYSFRGYQGVNADSLPWLHLSVSKPIIRSTCFSGQRFLLQIKVFSLQSSQLSYRKLKSITSSQKQGPPLPWQPLQKQGKNLFFTPFQVGGIRPLPFWGNRGCRISLLLFGFFFLFFPAPTSQAAWFEALCVVLLAALTSKTSGLTALQSSKEKPCCIQQNQQSSAWCQSPGQRWSGVPDWKQQAPFGRTVKQRFLQHFWQEL